jgi:cadmium resistance protein CadD (predicted permease)
VVAFAATNIDGLFLTAALFSGAPGRARPVVAGTFLGIGALYAASMLLSLGAMALPRWAIAALGLLPLGIGVRQLLARRQSDEEQPPAAQGALSVAMINVAFGGDNIAVYTPLFAAGGAETMAVYGAVFAVLTGALVWTAHRLVTHPAIGAPLRRYGPPLVPWVLIGLGIWILLQAS